MDPSRALLQRYLADQSETAFRELVERHVDLVYQAALRRAGGDDALARDVAQTVFTDLARKAAHLPPTVVLAGWLYRHTGFVAAKMIRSEQRRRRREHLAFMENSNHTEPPASAASEDAALWWRMAPLLDDALGRLSANDRDALVLRFLEGRALREVGGLLGLSENSARMRVNRALEKLRTVLHRRGLASTALALGAALGLASSRQAPSGLTQTLAAGALNAAPAAAATGLAAAMASMPWWGQAAAVLGMSGMIFVPVKMLVAREQNQAAVSAAPSAAPFPAGTLKAPPAPAAPPPPAIPQGSAEVAAAPSPASPAPPAAPSPSSPPPPVAVTVPVPVQTAAAAPAAGETVKLKLGVVPAVMQFDQKALTVKPGQQVMLLFQNAKCPLQHNFLLIRPGRLNAMGALADKMLTDPEAFGKSYVPVSTDILAGSTKLLGLGQSEIIQFTAPSEPGDYPYLCTFPGHWRLMNGVLKVAP
ncbi:MAG: sigma-70 family RNA polymerase sigma factor [Verrucomicrobiota bacterium]